MLFRSPGNGRRARGTHRRLRRHRAKTARAHQKQVTAGRQRGTRFRTPFSAAGTQGQLARNTTTLSQHFLTKRVRIGRGKFPQMLDYEVTFTTPPGNAVVVITMGVGTSIILIESTWEPLCFNESVTVTVNEAVLAGAVGVPEMTPVF